MVDCLSWHSCYGSQRSSNCYSKRSTPISKKCANRQVSIQNQAQSKNKTKSSFSCISSNRSSSKKQRNINNNNNASPEPSEEQNSLLQFYMIDVTRERNLHLSTCSKDKRLLVFYNVPHGLYKMGVRNGDVLIFINEINVLKPPIALTIDRVKSEFTALRRQHKPIKIGVCRSSNRCLFSSVTMKHLSSLAFDEFENLSHMCESPETQKPSPNAESKRLLNLFSSKKKSSSIQKRNSYSNRDSGFVETDGDHSFNSNSNKYRSKASPTHSEEDDSMSTLKSFDSSDRSVKKSASEPVGFKVNVQSSKPSNELSVNQLLDKYRRTQLNLPTQVLTDGCFIYRREIIKRPTSNDTIIRGRKIAYQAANSPTLQSPMPNYTPDQVRELYGETDTKLRRSENDERAFHTPMIDAWNEKPVWKLFSSAKNKTKEECPLPKFHVDNSDQTISSSVYLSTGLSNPRTTTNTPSVATNQSEPVRGSFRSSIADRPTVTPSPLLLNVRFDFDKLTAISTAIENQSDSFDCIQPETSVDLACGQSIEKTSEKINSNSTESGSYKINHSPQSPYVLGGSIALTNNINLETNKNISSKLKALETMEIDSLIGLDDETTVSHNMAEGSRLDASPDSMFCNLNDGAKDKPPSSIDTDSLVLSNDRSNINQSPSNDAYHDVFTVSFETEKEKSFTEDFLELLETLTHKNDQSTTNAEATALDHKSSSSGSSTEIIPNVDKSDSTVLFVNESLDLHKDPSNELHESSGLTDMQNESINIDSATTEIESDFLSSSQEPDHETPNKVENLESVIHDVKLLIEQFMIFDKNFNTENAELLSFDALSPILNESASTKGNKRDDLLLDEEERHHRVTSNIDEDFEELYQHYLTNIDHFEQNNQHVLTPISEESSALTERQIESKIINSQTAEEPCLTLNVKRQPNNIGHYGFELDQTMDGKIKVSSIIDSYYCPNLNVDDEIIAINNKLTLTTLEQCHLLFHSLWYKQCEYVQILVSKPTDIQIKPFIEPMSLQSSSLSWPLSIAEAGKIIAVFILP